MPVKGEAPPYIKVPQLYKCASRIMRQYENKEGSLKTLVYQGRYREYRVIYDLLSNLINNLATVKTAIAVSKLLIEEPDFDPYLAQVLTAQLLSKGSVSGNCKPIIVLKDYEEKLKAAAEKGFVKEQKIQGKDALPRYVRINTLLGGLDRIHIKLKEEGYTLENYNRDEESYDGFLQRVKNLAAPYYLVDYHIPDLLVFPPRAPFWESILFKQNNIILQDKASCLPVFLSEIKEGSKVIDACAAPGNKTSYIAAKMNNKGKVVAVERDQKLFKIMKRRLHNRSASCVTVMNKDFFDVDPTDFGDIEYIFVDPSCSSSGTNVHRDEVSKRPIGGLASMQVRLLSHALSFPSVKEVIYSTCSIYEEENEKVVDDVLKKHHKTFQLANLGSQIQGWKHFGRPTFKFGDKCLRTEIEIDKCSGFFLAKFVRKDKNKTQKGKSDSHISQEWPEKTKQNLDTQSSPSPPKKFKKGKPSE